MYRGICSRAQQQVSSSAMNKLALRVGIARKTFWGGRALARATIDQRYMATSASALPERAETVIIGGGCIGCGVAYSLVPLPFPIYVDCKSPQHFSLFPCSEGACEGISLLCNISAVHVSHKSLCAQAKAGKKDVVVLEKESALATVTTAQAAGLVGQVRDNLERVKLAMWSVQTFSDLQNDSEINPNWRYLGTCFILPLNSFFSSHANN